MDGIYLVVLQSSKKMVDFADLYANVESCLAELESYYNMNVDLSEAARAHVHASFMQLRIKVVFKLWPKLFKRGRRMRRKV